MANITIKIYRHSKAATAVSILSSVAAMFGVGFFIFIFRGYKTEGIWGTAISFGLAILFAFIASKIAKDAENPKPPLERQRTKHKICRILHYAVLGSMLASYIASFATYFDENTKNISDTFSMVGAALLFLFIPVMVIFLVSKIKLKRILKKEKQKQGATQFKASERD